MPELPEVETIRRGLEQRIIGDEICLADVRVPKMFRGEPKDIFNSPITAVRRIAKVLIIDFANGRSLMVHFKMTGQLVYVKHQESFASKIEIDNKKVAKGQIVADDIAIGGHPEKAYENPLPHKHTHIIYSLKSGATLYYSDLRKFGWHKVVKTGNIAGELGKEFAGVDILDPAFTLDYFKGYLAQRPNRPIKEVIMDQRYLTGIGNIYAAEALWHAKVLPDRLAKTLTAKEQKALFEALYYVIDLALKHGGSTFNSYVDAAGKQGTFMRYAEVYKKSKDSLGHEVMRMKQGGRTTHYCPICQR